ncbi:MAG: chemotaxis protein CheW [Archangium sp.]|nr:chemotaxis protein CheW [Archangium sp.]
MSPVAGESLVVMRVGGWRCAIPLARVERVLSAAMPLKVPRGDDSAFVVRLGDTLAPVIFAAALFGAGEVELRLTDKMVVLRLPEGPCVLWVEAVEDLAPHVPLGDRAPAGRYVACFSGGDDSLAVLDLDRVGAEHLAPMLDA